MSKKRFWGEFPNNDVITCDKIRDWDKRIVTIKEWDPTWKNVIIIDDLIQTWWTIRETADELRNKWAKSVTSYATHWVFPRDSHVELAKSVDRLIVTDSIPVNVQRAKQISNINILPIRYLVEKIIFRNLFK